uniref:V-myc myelocytomatosis viral oncogene homolog 1, lung carcinoma derived (Avian) a n=1 Tax=Nothobranchius pienaari TaxID=704102 RepID=A0A1A8PDL6_9TELE
MLGISSAAPRHENWDIMDHLDHYQHYFYDDHDLDEDFFKSTAPSEDIWKKFELVPTPPMSPIRAVEGSAKVGLLCPTLGDKLEWVSQFLGQEDEQQHPQEVPCKLATGSDSFGNLSSIIIQDCMWSSGPACKEMVAGRVPAVAQTGALPTATARPSKAQCASPGSFLSTATDCVDPAAVLTIPASSCRKPASSGSESRSDSSDDEEEIDVVTVESKQNRMRLVRKPVTLTVRADPCPKRFHVSVHKQQHNYAARSPDSDPEPDEEDDDDEEEEDDYDEEPNSKRTCAASHLQPASPSDSSQNSDVEDTDRRRNHNFLERKRRNDLRSRFLALRDQIPGLESAKAPKVAILTQATEYLMKLHIREKRQLQEKRRLRSRQQQLLRRLSELHCS